MKRLFWDQHCMTRKAITFFPIDSCRPTNLWPPDFSVRDPAIPLFSMEKGTLTSAIAHSLCPSPKTIIPNNSYITLKLTLKQSIKAVNSININI